MFTRPGKWLDSPWNHPQILKSANIFRGFSGFPTSGQAESKSSKTSKAEERQVQGASLDSNKMAERREFYEI